ncbi:LysR substrate-binding domain-containing protein [Streptomyces inhibens]|uniref:LysR substrate-binding domain-containing protein n=1 Tax=Streptomyces inhibens TaxID=2293571 RepID=UPI0036B11397
MLVKRRQLGVPWCQWSWEKCGPAALRRATPQCRCPHRDVRWTITGSLSALLRLTGHGHGVSLLPELAVARELEQGELVELRLTEPIRPVSIIAQWHPRLGLAERPLRALLDVARRADPLPEVSHRA